jgi:hypothetical protein
VIEQEEAEIGVAQSWAVLAQQDLGFEPGRRQRQRSNRACGSPVS